MSDHDATRDICLRRSPSECSDCSIKDRIECRFRRRSLLRFFLTFLVCIIPAFAGVILAGYGWFIVGWIIYMALFLQVWENRILCSHCPYYAEEGTTLRCHANYGLRKLWKYQPGPMSRWERLQFVLGLILIVAYPLPFMILGGQYLLFGITCLTILIFLAILSTQMCVHCMNFSCPLNRVPKAVIDTFLRQNPPMKKAWEEAGYKLDPE
ncbi:MAG: hypothetical protein ACFFCO_05550 [Promethearchaeota archaeon]